MKSKKGQAALEFLMTYGWAILVVLVVISALAYFGVLNPDALVPDKCTLVTGLSCDDYIITNDDGIRLKLGNGLGKPMYIINITAKSPDGVVNSRNCAWVSDSLNISNKSLPYRRAFDEAIFENMSNTLISNGGSATFTLLGASSDTTWYNCTKIDAAGRKPRFNLAITYYFADSDSTFFHTATGELMAKVQ